MPTRNVNLTNELDRFVAKKVKTRCARLEEFWSDIWGQAESALRSSDKIIIVGYSMPSADEAARTLLLDKSNKDARVSICCGEGSEAIRDQFVSHGFRRLEPLKTKFFEDFLSR